MKLGAIIQARALAFIELYDLDPRGRMFFPDVVRQIQQRYNFLKAPQPSEIDERKGVEFQTGKIGDRGVDALKLYETLFAVETHSNTNESKLILEDLLQWGKEKLGLTYEPRMIRHWAYVSIVTFYSSTKLPAMGNPPLLALAAKTTKAVSEMWGESITYEPSSLGISHDPLARKTGILSFTIQPRAETPYSENKYYSEAPLSTDLHLQFLEEFEADVIAQKNKAPE